MWVCVSCGFTVVLDSFAFSNSKKFPPSTLPQMKPWGVFQATSNYPQRLLYLLHSTLWLSCHDVLTQLSPLPTNAACSLTWHFLLLSVTVCMQSSSTCSSSLGLTMQVSHHFQYPPRTEVVYSYFESRGGKFPSVCFFGLQYILKVRVFAKAI